MKVTDLVGKRALLKVNSSSCRMYDRGDVTEFRVLEASPSGSFIKLMNMYGQQFWKPVPDISFVEELVDIVAVRVAETKTE
jgi:hypothetical protein